MIDLSVNLAGLRLANPTMTCSGTCGYAFEYGDFMDLSKLGAFVSYTMMIVILLGRPNGLFGRTAAR